MANLRKRNAQKSSSDELLNEDRYVLDEHEQEEIIAKLRRKVKKTNERSTIVLQGLVTVSGVMQVLFIISPSFFLEDKPIFAARFYLFLNIILHVNLLLVLSPELEKWMEKSDPAFDFSEQDAWIISYFSLIAPVVSFMCWRGWTQTIWWCSTAILSSSVRLGVRGIKEGDLSIENLEKLKYEMKGA